MAFKMLVNFGRDVLIQEALRLAQTQRGALRQFVKSVVQRKVSEIRADKLTRYGLTHEEFEEVRTHIAALAQIFTDLVLDELAEQGERITRKLTGIIRLF